MKMKIQRRRGSALITVFIVLIFLGLISASMMRTIYTNMISARQEYVYIRSRVAANSVLFSVGSKISEDFAKGETPLDGELKKGMIAKAFFKDGPLNISVDVETRNPTKTYGVICRVRHDPEISQAEKRPRVFPIVERHLEVSKQIVDGKTKIDFTWPMDGDE